MAASTDDKMQNKVKCSHVVSSDPLFEFWGSIISKLAQRGSCGCHVTHFWNFGIPLIYPGRMKLETSNLAERWTAVCTGDKMQNKIKWGHVGSSDPLFEFWDFIISPGRR